MRKFNSDIRPGLALVVCTEQGIYANAECSEKLIITSLDSDDKEISAEYNMHLPELRKVASEGGFFSYIAGVAAYMLNYYRIGGMTLNILKMTLPQKKGLSSSAAICTLTARGFNKLYNLNLTTHGEMECAYGGEQLTPSRCGRLDQAVAFDKGIVHMKFDGDRLNVNPAKIGAPLYLVFADLNAEKDTMTILRDLNSAYPYPKTSEHRGLHILLGEINERIIGEVTAALEEGNIQHAGKLMTEAQSLFDTYAVSLSPEELASPTLHTVLNDTALKQWVFGGKGVGSQGDGAVQFIVRDSECGTKLINYLHKTYGILAYSIAIPKTAAVRKAVIPVAGHGTRMLPATSVIKKDLLPVVDFDGKAKPMLQILVENLRSSDVEEICLVIHHGEEELYQSLFGDTVEFAYQDDALGFGHAVLQSERFADGEPVIVCLGDHLFTSNTEESAFTQLIAAYEKSKQLTIGLFELPLAATPHYGVAKFAAETALSVLVEKPTVEYAKQNLQSNGKYYGMFMYVITPHVYAELRYEFDGNNTVENLQLTSALNRVTRKFGAIGAIISGRRYDIGLPEQYRITVADYGRV
jgi:UTP-glucose-1-phosphate uridylyltransferase/mevalonate kinase